MADCFLEEGIEFFLVFFSPMYAPTEPFNRALFTGIIFGADEELKIRKEVKWKRSIELQCTNVYSLHHISAR